MCVGEDRETRKIEREKSYLLEDAHEHNKGASFCFLPNFTSKRMVWTHPRWTGSNVPYKNIWAWAEKQGHGTLAQSMEIMIVKRLDVFDEEEKYYFLPTEYNILLPDFNLLPKRLKNSKLFQVLIEAKKFGYGILVKKIQEY